MSATRLPLPVPLDIEGLRHAYLAGQLTPLALVERLLPHWQAPDHHCVWLSQRPAGALWAEAEALMARDPASLPLYGIPCAVKDNIDVAGLPTTAGCPAYSYLPEQSAPVVAALVQAGALIIGKTHMDQFAAGLVGTRSPHGPCLNAFDPDYIAGGSSSGSAVAVALGQVSFALGTDTAGSGRVPAAFNNLIGLKPSRGWLSTRGVVPACPSLDCISVFTLSAHDASVVLHQIAGTDALDPWGRVPAPHDLPPPGQGLTIAVPNPESLEFHGNHHYAAAFARARAALEALGVPVIEYDFNEHLAVARSLYGSARLAERIAALEPWLGQNWSALHPVTAQVLAPGLGYRADAAWASESQLRQQRLRCDRLWQQAHAVLMPTAPTHYTQAEVAADPIGANARLGHYTNFMNLLDLAAVALPAGMSSATLPFGVTLFGPAGSDSALLALADRLHRQIGGRTGCHGPDISELPAVEWPELEYLPIVVCGAHMGGLPLNGQLTSRGGRFLRATCTAPGYRLYALPGGPPFRPGLVRDPAGGAIECEVWSLPRRAWGDLLALVPPPLAFGRVLLADGTAPTGFVCETWGLEGAEDITALGGWRAFLARGK